jgi:ABC-type bacteriocin/lantibiotic exporter with double-glycine peptidase domain
MLRFLQRVVSLLDASQRRRAGLVLLLSVITAALETIGVGSIVPFMMVVTSPDKIGEVEYLSTIYNWGEFSDVSSFAFAIGVAIIVVLLLNNSFRALTMWSTLRFSSQVGQQISHKVLTQYLYQPYRFFLDSSSAELRRSVLGDVQGLVGNILVPLIDIASKGFVVAALLCLLLVANPIASIAIGGGLGLVYLLLYVSIRRWLLRLGQSRVIAQTQRHRTVNEAILGIKNIKIMGYEHTYLRLFDGQTTRFVDATIRSGVVSQLPRYALEVLAFGGIVAVVLFELSKNAEIDAALPLLTLYAFAGYRLLPNFQGIFAAVSTLRFNSAIFQKVEEQITRTASGLGEFKIHQSEGYDAARLGFSRNIVLKDLSFRYSDDRGEVLKDFNLTIERGSSVGIVGKTGSGKTTLVDILSGMLAPTNGELLVDGVEITPQNVRNWQKNISYVGQHIYLTESSIRQNIAFGLEDGDIDDGRIREAARMAAIDRFIETELPQGYDTLIGENGAKLSGGQRQRIGLARALFLNRPILILDEATSALDGETEKEVLAAIDGLRGSCTILSITHRLSTLQRMDKIIELQTRYSPVLL